MIKAPSVIKLFYVGGYGRSGSTLLESLLATYPNILACGEVVSCLRDRADRACTCGKSRYECDVWSTIYRPQEKLRGWTHTALTLSLLEWASGKYDAVVDSSKTAWGAIRAPFKLRRQLGARIQLIHLVRDPRGVCWSNIGPSWKREAVVKNEVVRHIRTVLGWWVANLSCELFGKLYPTQYSRVRYEDLSREYQAVLKGLLVAQQIQTVSSIHEKAKANRHQLFGNFGRYREVSPSEIREDARWRRKMPPTQRAFVSITTWPLRTRYGY